MNISALLRLLGVAGLTIALSSCAVTEASLKASSETFENTSDASSEFTSSTSPRDKDKSARKVKEFTSTNFERLREDMAIGEGEHLTSLAALLEISAANRPAFFRLTREHFSSWFGSGQTTPDEIVAELTAELSHHPEWRR